MKKVQKETNYKLAKQFFKQYANKQLLLASVSGNLTREQREIIKLVDIEGLKLEEACDELNMSLTPLKNKRIKAYTIMYKLFSEEGLI